MGSAEPGADSRLNVPCCASVGSFGSPLKNAETSKRLQITAVEVCAGV